MHLATPKKLVLYCRMKLLMKPQRSPLTWDRAASTSSRLTARNSNNAPTAAEHTTGGMVPAEFSAQFSYLSNVKLGDIIFLRLVYQGRKSLGPYNCFPSVVSLVWSDA